MKPYVVAPEAEDDLRQIWSYLFDKAGLEVADRIQEEFLTASKSWSISRAKAIGAQI